MVLRRCSICDRNFTKAEHYLRHQRSHTKERPYECPTCKKRFSRSDVLFRHTKLHTQQPSDGRGESSSNPSAGMIRKSPSNGRMESITQEQIGTQTSFNPPERTMFMQDQPFGEVHMSQSRHMSMPDISHGHGPYEMNPQQPGPMTHLTPAHTFSGAGFSPGQEYSPNSIHPGMSNQTYDPHLVPMDHQPMTGMISETFGAISSNAQGRPQDMLQFWLSQADSDFGYSQLPLPDINNNAYALEVKEKESQPQLPRDATSETSEATSTSNIPHERFARVERCWIAKSITTHHLAPSMWPHIARYPGPNLFTDEQTQARESSDSRWGLDAETRSRLEVEFGPNAPGYTHLPRHSNLAFPPPEVLDICLDMYFRGFHPMAPFIHVPTFSASRTPLPLLYSMCLLGLSALESGGGGNFINHAFSILLRKVHNDLAVNAVTPSAPHERLALFAAGFLTLSLAALSGDQDRMIQSQMLHATLLATAQKQGLFSAENLVMDEMLSEFDDGQSRWLAWARIESVKRLIAALVTTDWWFAANSSVNPTIRPETVQVYLPCDDVLFKAESSQRWMQLLKSGKMASAPLIRPRTFNLEGALDPIIVLDPPLDAPGQYTLLSIIKLCVCDAQHRHFLPSDDWDRHDHLIPWKTFRDDLRGRSLVQTILALAPLITGSPRTADLNSIVLWHNTCLSLNSNIQIFELAAGRAGAGPAGKALSDVADWTQTPSARRACIHAAQTFKLLSNRKVSESITLNSMSALFCSALVLGLYVFTVTPQPGDVANTILPYDLLDDVDWTIVGDAGMAERSPENSPGMMFESAHASNSTRAFIELGGPIMIGGVAAVGGYQSARRTLLDFAHLMDGIGAWKPRTLSRILHIMSDVLEDSF